MAPLTIISAELLQCRLTLERVERTDGGARYVVELHEDAGGDDGKWTMLESDSRTDFAAALREVFVPTLIKVAENYEDDDAPPYRAAPALVPTGWLSLRRATEDGACLYRVVGNRCVTASGPSGLTLPRVSDDFVLVRLWDSQDPAIATTGHPISVAHLMPEAFARLAPEEIADSLAGTRDTVARVADVFAARLRDVMGPSEFAAVRARNAREPADASVCHSHDFCDANEVMHSALGEVTGWAMPDDIEGTEWQRVWNLAWARAKDKHLRGEP